MDDIALVCNPDAAAAAWATVVAELATDGFGLSAGRMTAWRAQGAPASLPEGFNWAPDGLVLAGVPIGPPEAVRRHVTGVVAAVTQHVDNIAGMAAHGAKGYARRISALRLLHHAPARLTFLSRCVEPAHLVEAAALLQQKLPASFAEVFELHDMTDHSAAQLHLSRERGGFDMPWLEFSSLCAAFVASAELTAPAVRGLTGINFLGRTMSTPLERTVLDAARHLTQDGLAPTPACVGGWRWAAAVKRQMQERLAARVEDALAAGDAALHAVVR